MMRRFVCMKLFVSALFTAAGLQAAEPLDAFMESQRPSLIQLYEHLHANPELSFHEAKTSARMAEEIRALGFEVTEKVGGFGVVAVLKNGPGKTVLVRTDLDGLPVRENLWLSARRRHAPRAADEQVERLAALKEQAAAKKKLAETEEEWIAATEALEALNAA